MSTRFVVCSQCGVNVSVYLLYHHQRHCLNNRTNITTIDDNDIKTESRPIEHLPCVVQISDYTIEAERKPHLNLRLRGGCFISGTKVLLSNNHEIEIENIKIGDTVITYNMKQNKLQNHKVLNLLKYFVNELSIITTQHNTKLICTPTHPIYVLNKQKWCSVQLNSFNPEVNKLEIGDTLMINNCDNNNQLKSAQIINIKSEYFKNYIIPVYTLHIENIHNFFANNILVHNAMQIMIKTIPTINKRDGTLLTSGYIREIDNVLSYNYNSVIPQTIYKLCLQYYLTQSVTYTIIVEPNDTIAHVKLKLQQKSRMLPSEQMLVFAAKQLEDGRTLSDYGIHKLSTLNVIHTNTM